MSWQRVNRAASQDVSETKSPVKVSFSLPSLRSLSNSPCFLYHGSPASYWRMQLNGTAERPRLAVFLSNQRLYAQVIDEHTLAAASTLSKEIRDAMEGTAGPTIDAAKKVGEAIGQLCLERGISKVAFDRGGFVYHGRIKALADAAREAGLDF